jgi:hypothetical protein
VFASSELASTGVFASPVLVSALESIAGASVSVDASGLTAVLELLLLHDAMLKQASSVERRARMIRSLSRVRGWKLAASSGRFYFAR